VSARLEIVPSNLLSLEWEVRENGTPVGRIENAPLQVQEKGKLTADGGEYFVLREAEMLLAKKVLAGRETYLLTDSRGGVLCFVREGLLSRQMSLELEERAAGLPREIVLFLVWIVLLIHGRDSPGSAG